MMSWRHHMTSWRHHITSRRHMTIWFYYFSGGLWHRWSMASRCRDRLVMTSHVTAWRPRLTSRDVTTWHRDVTLHSHSIFQEDYDIDEAWRRGVAIVSSWRHMLQHDVPAWCHVTLPHDIMTSHYILILHYRKIMTLMKLGVEVSRSSRQPRHVYVRSASSVLAMADMM